MTGGGFKATYPSFDGRVVVFRGHIPPNTVVTGASTVVWTEDTDTHNTYGGGTGVITVPAGMGGLYLIALAWKPAAAIQVGMNVRKNGSTVIVTPSSNNATTFSGMTASLILDLAAADALTFQFSAGFTTTNDAVYNTWCHVVRLRS